MASFHAAMQTIERGLKTERLGIPVLAAQAGKHLYLDKPLAGSLREADSIVAVCESDELGDLEPWSPPKRNPNDPMGMWLMPPGSPFSAKPRQSWLTPPSMLCETYFNHFLDCIEHGNESAVSAEVAAAATDKTIRVPPR